MTQHIHLFIALCFSLVACASGSATDSGAENPNPSVSQTGQTDENPQDMDIKNYLKWLPASLFDNTTEGLSEEEKLVLFAKGESDAWMLKFQSPLHLTYECKHPESVVDLHLLEGTDSPVLLAYTVNEGARILETWALAAENAPFEKAYLLPRVPLNLFYQEKDQVKNPDDYSGNVYFTLDSIGNIKMGIDIFMMEELENKEIKFDVFLKWDGSAFSIDKKPKS